MKVGLGGTGQLALGVALFALLLAPCSRVLAQGDDCRITGYVNHAMKGNTAIADAEVLMVQGGRTIATTRTSAEGKYQITGLAPGKYTLRVRKTNFADAEFPVQLTRQEGGWQNANLLPRVNHGNYQITLSWCTAKTGAVKDIDAYLKIPGVSEPLSFKRRGQDYQGTHLDVDDRDWRGPETTTIRELRDGRYIFYVNNYDNRSSSTALGKSSVTVQLNRGNEQIRTYTIPAGRGITYEVFWIEGDEVKHVERYNNSLFVHGRQP